MEANDSGRNMGPKVISLPGIGRLVLDDEVDVVGIMARCSIGNIQIDAARVHGGPRVEVVYKAENDYENSGAFVVRDAARLFV